MNLPSAKLNDRLALDTPSGVHGSDDFVSMLLQDIFFGTEEIILCRLGRELVVNPKSGLSVQEEGRKGPLMCRPG